MTDAPKLSGSQVTAAACVAVIVPGLGAWLGAHTGTKGTVVGTAIGAILSVLCGWAVLRLTYHARSGLARVPWDKTQPWHYVVAAVAVFAVAMVAVTGVEAKVLPQEPVRVRDGICGLGDDGWHRVANHPAKPAAARTEPPEASSAPVTAAPSTVSSAPGIPSPAVTVSPTLVPSTSVPPPGGAASPATTGEPS